MTSLCITLHYFIIALAHHVTSHHHITLHTNTYQITPNYGKQCCRISAPHHDTTSYHMTSLPHITWSHYMMSLRHITWSHYVI